MPIMPRPNTKATKIAYKVLGKPQNLKPEKLSPEEKKVKQRLVFEETIRVR